MVKEKYYGTGNPFWGWRCVFCGEIFDSVIWKNRNQRSNDPLAEYQGAQAKRREITSPQIGEILKYQPTGGLFEVKRVTQNWVILFSRDGLRQIMTEREGFNYLFARLPLVGSSMRKSA